MVEIVFEKVYRRKNNTGTRIDVEPGEIALVYTKRWPALPKIGVVKQIRYCTPDKKHILMLSPAYGLKAGTSVVDSVGVSNGRVDSRFIEEFFLGMEGILKKLDSEADFRVHCEWIRKLEKPYNFPEIKNLR